MGDLDVERKAIHESIFQSPQATHGFVISFIAELDALKPNDLGRANTPGSGHPGQRRPKRPPAGSCKIHVDAGVLTRRGGSAAAVCRDEWGNYMGSSALVVEGVVDSATLEAVACREALSLAKDMGIQNFVVASDCRQVVSDINMSARVTYGAIITEINLKASTFYCNFSFESRVVNYEAHSLAMFSLT